MNDKPSWKIRRRVVLSTLVFCAACVIFVMGWGDARSVQEVVVMCAFGLAFATIGSYVFGAAWDDKNYMSLVQSKKQPDKPQYEDDGFPPDPNEV
jgi:hypothetical protein